MQNATLNLLDGTCLQGRMEGADRDEVHGEVVFCTAMTGYMEVVTDPSYAGQIVVLTYPQIGNYGAPAADMQSSGAWPSAIVVREFTRSGRHDVLEFCDFLKEHGIVGLSGVDTRALTRKLRSGGTTLGRISSSVNPRPIPPLDTLSEVARVQSNGYDQQREGPKVTVLDFGLKNDIVAQLSAAGAMVQVRTPQTPLETLLAERPDGVVISNGPGDPQMLRPYFKVVRELAERLPVLGICLGHQLICLSFGGSTYALKFGHHGINHPIQELGSGRVTITSHNHGYAVDEDSLGRCGFDVTHRHLTDQTVEGIMHQSLPVYGVQYHPEASPGPWEERQLFGRFLNAVEGAKH